MSEFTKRSFTSGEISPSLRARNDLNKFHTALATCKNFIALPEGGVVNRPGFEYLGTEKKSSLIPFQFNQNDSYMLAFGDNRLAVYRYGEKVHSVSSPYSYNDMTTAQFVQNADVITIAHIDHPLRTLTRFANDDWRFEEVSFLSDVEPPADLKSNVVGTDSESPKKQYEYVVTKVIDGKESTQSIATIIVTNALSETWGVRLSWSGTGDSFNIYKSVSPSTNIYGWVGNSKTNEFTDYNIAPLSSEGVVKDASPFNDVEATLSVSGSAQIGETVTGAFSALISRIEGDTYTLVDVSPNAEIGDTLTSSGVSFLVNDASLILPGFSLSLLENVGRVISINNNELIVEMVNGDFNNGDEVIVNGLTKKHYRISNTTETITNPNAGDPGEPDTITNILRFSVGDVITSVSGATGTISSIDTQGSEQLFALVEDPTIPFTGNEKISNQDDVDATITDILDQDEILNVTLTSAPSVTFSATVTDVKPIANPSVINYYQQRLTLANTLLEPITFFASKTTNQFDFRKSEPVGDSDAIEFSIASGQYNEIRHIVSMKDLLLITSGAIWLVTEGQNEVLTPASISLDRVAKYGASKVRVLEVGGSVLFIQSKGNRIRDIYSLQDYQSDDISILSQHLFRDHEIVSWCYQEDPHGVIWAVRSDGVLLGLTYHKGHQVWGWHVHETQGSFVSVECVTETDRDSVYACVERGGKHHIERLSYRKDDKYENFTFLDSYKQFYGTKVLNGLDHLIGKEVVILADGFVSRQTLSESTLTLDRSAKNIIVGLGYECDLETLDIDPQGTNTNGKLLQVPSLSVKFQNTVGGYFGQSFDKLLRGKWRSRSDNYDPIALSTEDISINTQPGWNDNGRICIRQKDPLPMHVLAITPTVLMGGRGS